MSESKTINQHDYTNKPTHLHSNFKLTPSDLITLGHVLVRSAPRVVSVVRKWIWVFLEDDDKMRDLGTTETLVVFQNHRPNAEFSYIYLDSLILFS